MTDSGVRIFGGVGALKAVCISASEGKDTTDLVDLEHLPETVVFSYTEAEDVKAWETPERPVVDIGIPFTVSDTFDAEARIVNGTVYARLSRRASPREADPPGCRVSLPGPAEPYRPAPVTLRENTERLVNSLRMLGSCYGNALDDLEQVLANLPPEERGPPIPKNPFLQKLEDIARMRAHLAGTMCQFGKSQKMNQMLEEIRSYNSTRPATLKCTTALFLVLDPTTRTIWDRLIKSKDTYTIPTEVSNPNRSYKCQDNLWREIRAVLKSLGKQPAKELAHRVGTLKMPSDYLEDRERTMALNAMRTSEELMGQLSEEELMHCSSALISIKNFMQLIYKLNAVLEDFAEMKRKAGIDDEEGTAKEKLASVAQAEAMVRDQIQAEGEKMMSGQDEGIRYAMEGDGDNSKEAFKSQVAGIIKSNPAPPSSESFSKTLLAEGKNSKKKTLKGKLKIGVSIV